jgi:hypothetical protein
MTRVEFTQKITDLLQEMILAGESPIIDYAKRSPQEQSRLFKIGLSKCDGFKKVSGHQKGTAMDIYFIENGELVDEPKQGWGFWHNRWDELGGQSELEWDKGHFEG